MSIRHDQRISTKATEQPVCDIMMANFDTTGRISKCHSGTFAEQVMDADSIQVRSSMMTLVTDEARSYICAETLLQH